MYLSLNHISFYSFLMGKEAKIIIPYTDIMVKLDKKYFNFYAILIIIIIRIWKKFPPYCQPV
jgi:hypothetical protein